LQSFRKNSPVPVAVAEGTDCAEVLIVMLWPQWLHVRFLSPAVPSLQTSRREVGDESGSEHRAQGERYLGIPHRDAHGDPPPQVVTKSS
jgi:hypothetical protein